MEEHGRRARALMTALLLLGGLGLLSSPIALLVPGPYRLGVLGLFVGALAFEAVGVLLAWRGWVDTAATVTGCGISAVIAWSTVSMNLVTEVVWFLGLGLLVASFASSPRVVGIVYLVDLALLALIQGRVPVLLHAGDKVPLLPSVLSLLTAMAMTAALNAHFANRSLQHLRAANKQAEAARRAAETANRTKNLFLANMSHELRTPLSAIIGYSDLLIEEPEELPEPVRDDIERIRRSGHHLLALISDVLDLSRIEAERLPLVLAPVEVRPLCAEVLEKVAPLAATHRDVLQMSVPPEPGALVTDRTRLAQVLLNLLTNAAKFTRDGQIELTVTPRDGGLEWAVRDTGLGMDSAVLERIFEPFVQGDGAGPRELGGVGLGLALSRRLARLLGGQLTVESEVGRGSTFRLWLPLVHPEAVSTAEPMPEAESTLAMRSKQGHDPHLNDARAAWRNRDRE